MREAASRHASARAGGKVILLGEHAVVYGSPAIAVGLGVGAEAHVRVADAASITLAEREYVLGPSDASGGVEPDVSRAFRVLLSALQSGPIHARAELAIPAGAGLGASAALGVALARATLKLASGEDALVARAALAWENVFHGNASGLDTAAAEHGGCLWFTRADGPTPLGPGAPLRLRIALVEPGASTRAMIQGVLARKQADNAAFERCMASIAQLVAAAREAIAHGRIRELGELMNENHERLQELGVSTPGLDQARAWALDAGALGAKLTGAGGGGCVVAVVDDASAATVERAWAERGLRCLTASA